MAHEEQIKFCEMVKNRFPQFFKGINVIDCGSLDINGNNRYLFEDCSYVGVDLGPGKNVDIVSLVHEVDSPDGHYDVVISTEALEHDLHWQASLRNMVRILRPGGLLLITCATAFRPEHGTTSHGPENAPLLPWPDYYRNVSETELGDTINLDNFPEHEFRMNPHINDLYFWGIKAACTSESGHDQEYLPK